MIFVGDAGVAEASRPSRRLGVEWTNYLRLASWLTGELDVFYTVAPAGRPAGGVDDVHFHPSIPRTARVLLNARF